MTTSQGSLNRRRVAPARDGRPIEAITLDDGRGLTATVLTLGGTLQALTAPDRTGLVADVVLGHDDAETYWRAPGYQGATVGRFANRIRGGRFTLDGTVHQLERNDGDHHLHGGRNGFDQRLWSVESIGPAELKLGLVSPDGDGGYPGQVTARSRWSLDGDTLTIAFEATTTRPTVINLTNHAFFNLGGIGCGRPATDHALTLFADAFTPIDAGLIPTGEIRSVEGTPFDLREGRPIAQGLAADEEQRHLGGGYDHNVVVRGERGVLRPAARLEDAVSGRRLEVSTTEAGLQVYSGHFLDGAVGKGGVPMRPGDGVCLEPQTFPDAPNQPGFPSARLDPGQIYRHTIRFRLSVF